MHGSACACLKLFPVRFLLSVNCPKSSCKLFCGYAAIPTNAAPPWAGHTHAAAWGKAWTDITSSFHGNPKALCWGKALGTTMRLLTGCRAAGSGHTVLLLPWCEHSTNPPAGSVAVGCWCGWVVLKVKLTALASSLVLVQIIAQLESTTGHGNWNTQLGYREWRECY